MDEIRTGMIAVQGAHLYVKVRGSGPDLMMLSGGAADADGFDSLAHYLATHYTVITYDRRGLSRSVIEDSHPPEVISVSTHSEDVHLILSAIRASPARVFGSSIGGLIGLDLLIRHPDDVLVLAAHEPPIGELLDEREKPRVSLRELYARSGDADEAIPAFAASLSNGDMASLRPVPYRKASATRSANNRFFLEHDQPAVASYRLDIERLKSLRSRIVVLGGEDGREFFPYTCALRLAGRLSITLQEVPGNHGGYALRPAEFARSLWGALESVGSTAS
jgi:pimeloyl-ACP methyl ester carboxylesterase